MATERLEFIIRRDGTVEEKVEGVPGPRCERLTEPFEDGIGEVVERVHSAEYVLRPAPAPQRAGAAAKAREEKIGA
ncbi:MAG: hypothetical protein COZ06_22805 [Armatimonadetes bacterium CG_4_10_14_3_um_filter_66_18]|nr:DUF2997 domain-containing protein [Armatimonadota bacterium]OIP11780.1 MAG: hypothetical protein AUJ96_01710 [Armatimonadetes bacterium CG2_30_66_41]PIU90594.1 MAG: hypothetical protein COS65_24605 [Armatimonadetes bacterium CG06_land_8_20_14_3_00_66_21]PIX43795.1 MAG: hypothetical protein COZ57_18520 [Armatimonadetes bacterium CG_4_8_14_3_um_filter_66_20]PIY43465.1 MAG: hypothetical protein COZ06_22805 [Armatimonadetes bacterium CG_4_10_14_3_um_filter_66_18]PIZ48829.1 MAG: hypothetical pro